MFSHHRWANVKHVLKLQLKYSSWAITPGYRVQRIVAEAHYLLPRSRGVLHLTYSSMTLFIQLPF